MDLIGRQIGNYIVRKQLGAGGMGTVYLCEHPLLGRHVALKVLHEEHARDPDTVERFFREAKAANAIHHPNIVDVSDFGSIEGEGGPTIYLVMEALEGRSLAAALPTLTVPEALHVTRQCAHALAASHARGIVHRDLKPENIFLISRDGDPHFVKIVDFGIAKLMNPGEGGRTQVGTILGTPVYMSPEQCEGRGHVDQRADIYSLGVVLYEMLAKDVPFRADNFAKLAIMHMTKEPPPPSQHNPLLSPELDAIVLHALAKRPDDRFQSMDELLVALDDPVGHLAAWKQMPGPPPARSGSTLVIQAAPQRVDPTLEEAAAEVEAPPEPPPWRGHRVAMAAIGMAALIAGAVAAVVVNWRPADTPPPPVAVVTAPEPVPVEPPPAAVVPDAAPARVVVPIEAEPPAAVVTPDAGPLPVAKPTRTPPPRPRHRARELKPLDL